MKRVAYNSPKDGDFYFDKTVANYCLTNEPVHKKDQERLQK